MNTSQSPRRRFGLFGIGLAATGLLILVGGWFAVRGTDGLRAPKDADGNNAKADIGAIPVTTVQPRHKTLERYFQQPGTVEPGARAELYAKSAGFLKRVYPATTPELPSAVVAQVGASQMSGGGPAGPLLQLALIADLVSERAPELDIGAFVCKGDILLEVDVPERLQDVTTAEIALRQREAERGHSTAVLLSYAASVEVAKAQKVQAEADQKRYDAELEFRSKELRRLRDLAARGTITTETADEKESQVEAVRSALEASKAKVKSLDAEIALATTKFNAAREELKVKESQIEAAREAIASARILAEYSHVFAPFDGVINYRGVDVGDFVQNATSGQPRRLLVLSSLDRLKCVIHVPERDALEVRPGADVTMLIDARPDWAFKGHVARIDYTLDQKTRTMQVEIDMDNRDRKLLPGMYGRVQLSVQRVVGAQALPTTAIYSRKGENFIIQVIDGKARWQKVRIRFDNGKEVEVVKLVGKDEVPLDGTEEVVISNKGELSDGQRVRTTRSKQE